MGILNIFRGQFIDIVEWADETPGVLVHRFERFNHEIKNQAKLIVRPGQAAIFVNEGHIADHFGPGTYELTTANMPILTSLLSLPTNFESWHKAEAYFIKTTEQLDRRWGTPQPVMLRDAEFGIVRVRAFGNYSYRIGMTNDLLQAFVGSRAEFSADELEGQMTLKVVSELSDLLGEIQLSVLDLAAQYNELGEQLKLNLNSAVARLGIEIVSFTIGNINLPDDVTKAIDKRSALGALGGVMGQYTQMQAADAMLAAAQNKGTGGSMMGMMMGARMATMADRATGTVTPAEPLEPTPAERAETIPPPVPAEPTYFMAVNGQRQGPYTLHALQAMAINGTFTPTTLVWTTGMANWQTAAQVAALAPILAMVPPPIEG